MYVVPTAQEPIGKIPQLGWLVAPETRDVVSALAADGREVRFVGGCVRDTMAQRPVGDIDIATPDPPESVMELLQRAGIRAVPTGIEHGTVTAVIGEAKFEITTLRRDLETDGRHARVEFTDDWVEDASRRDFTINTLSATPEGDVYDPYNGIYDLANGRVRFVGLAHERVDEDVLRILRFFRFQGSYGKPPPDRDALAACRSRAEKLAQLSGERVRDELFRILMTPHPADVVLMMRGERILEHILPEIGDVNRLRMLSWLETRAVIMESIKPDSLRRLASLIDVDGAGAETVGARLRLSNRQRDRLVILSESLRDVGPDMGEAAEKRTIRRFGADTFCDFALLTWAKELAGLGRLPSERNQSWIAILERAEAWRQPEFPLTGNDVAVLGIAEGPRIGALLTRVEDWWENGGYKASRQACLDRLLKAVEEET